MNGSRAAVFHLYSQWLNIRSKLFRQIAHRQLRKQWQNLLSCLIQPTSSALPAIMTSRPTVKTCQAQRGQMHGLIQQAQPVSLRLAATLLFTMVFGLALTMRHFNAAESQSPAKQAAQGQIAVEAALVETSDLTDMVSVTKTFSLQPKSEFGMCKFDVCCRIQTTRRTSLRTTQLCRSHRATL